MTEERVMQNCPPCQPLRKKTIFFPALVHESSGFVNKIAEGHMMGAVKGHNAFTICSNSITGKWIISSSMGRIGFIVFVMLLPSLLFQKHSWAISSSNRVGLDGDELSVHVEGIAMGELLTVISEITEIEFRFDDSVSRKRIWLDLQAVPLVHAVRRIVYHCNTMTTYDASGKIVIVYVLDRSRRANAIVHPRCGDAGFSNPGSYLPSKDLPPHDLLLAEELTEDHKYTFVEPEDAELPEWPPSEDDINK